MAGSQRAIMIAKGLQTILNFGLLVLAVILVVFLGKETWHLATVLLVSNEKSRPTC